MTEQPQPIEQTPPPTRPYRWVIVAILLALVAGGLAWWSAAGRQAAERELAAKAELSQLGALVVMDGERKHVSSVNLSTLRSPDTAGRALALLADLSQLHSLNVAGMPFDDENAALVGQLASLQDLVLTKTAITDEALEKLAGLSRLKTLHLVDTDVTAAGMPSLGRLRSLKIIDLSGTKVTGNFEPLAALDDLNWLVAQRLTLDAAAMDAIGEMGALTRLTLRETTVPEDALKELVRKRPNLTIDR